MPWRKQKLLISRTLSSNSFGADEFSLTVDDDDDGLRLERVIKFV
jgi:hypothetical protein